MFLQKGLDVFLERCGDVLLFAGWAGVERLASGFVFIFLTINPTTSKQYPGLSAIYPLLLVFA